MASGVLAYSGYDSSIQGNVIQGAIEIVFALRQQSSVKERNGGFRFKLGELFVRLGRSGYITVKCGGPRLVVQHPDHWIATSNQT